MWTTTLLTAQFLSKTHQSCFPETYPLHPLTITWLSPGSPVLCEHTHPVSVDWSKVITWTNLGQRTENPYNEWYSLSFCLGVYIERKRGFSVAMDSTTWTGKAGKNSLQREKNETNTGRRAEATDRWRKDLDGEPYVQFIPKAQLHSCPWISWENPYFLLINPSPCPPSYLALISVAYDQN